MTIPRVFFSQSQYKIDATSCSENYANVCLGRSDLHHLQTVLRLTIGAQIELINSDSGQHFLALLQANGEASIIRTLNKTDQLNIAASLCFALCKGEKNDLVLEKSCELGVQRVIFWQSERSVSRIKDNAEQKLLRWQRILESAAKQCGRSSIPTVHLAKDVTKLTELLSSYQQPEDLIFLCSLTQQAKLARDIKFDRLGAAHIIIGPEGDISPAEHQHFIQFGAKELSLGSLILRAETAAITALASVNAVWG